MSQQFPPYGQPQRPPYGQQNQPGYYPPSPPLQQGYAQPMMPPPYYSPPKKKSRAWIWILVVVAVVLVGGCAIVVAMATTLSKSAPTETTTTQQSNSAPATAHHKTGETVSVDSTWQVTVSTVKTSQGSDFSTPKPGNVFLLVGVAMKNISGAQQAASSLIQWSLRDASGQKYTETIVSGATGPDGNVAAGDPLLGTLTYEVPASTKSFVLDFISTLGGSLVSFDITA